MEINRSWNYEVGLRGTDTLESLLHHILKRNPLIKMKLELFLQLTERVIGICKTSKIRGLKIGLKILSPYMQKDVVWKIRVPCFWVTSLISARKIFFSGIEVHQGRACKGRAAWGIRGRSPRTAEKFSIYFWKINDNLQLLDNFNDDFYHFF